MFAFVAVNEDRVIATIQNGGEGGSDLVGRNGDEGFFVSWNPELEKGDAIGVEKG